MSWGNVQGMGYVIENVTATLPVLVNQDGYTTAQAVGVAANLVAESGCLPTIREQGGGPGRGIAQWSAGARWDTLCAWCPGHGYPSPWTLNAQLAFLAHELITTEHVAQGHLLAAHNPADAAAAFQTFYERPADARTNVRRAISDDLFRLYGGTVHLDAGHGGVGYHCPVTLTTGIHGAYVTWLQVRLGRPVQDGVYSPDVVAAVRTFQQRYGLAIDGIAGPKTLGRLGWIVG